MSLYSLNKPLPTYDEIKKIKEYYTIDLYFPIYGGYFCLTLNEDGNHTIAIDYLEGGYLSNILHKFDSQYSFSKLYPFNKKNYEGLVKLYKQMLKIAQQELTDYINTLA